MDQNNNLAVLIDGDNIPSAQVKEMIEEIAKYGNPSIKRIYGDWTKPHLSKWKNLLLENVFFIITTLILINSKDKDSNWYYLGLIDGTILLKSLIYIL